MQVALVSGRRTIEFRELPEPEPLPGRAVVRIAYCGICGTDLEPWVSGDPYNPAICGHEWTGTVTALPSGVVHVVEGDRVGIGIAAACGECDPCRAGRGEYCEPSFMGLLGRGPLAAAHGGFAPSIAIDAGRLYRVRDGISDEAAAMLEPATVAFHAVRRTAPPADGSCVVLGAGPIGLLTLQCALAAGAGAALVVEPQPARRARAAELGATGVIDPGCEDVGQRVKALLGRTGPDTVYECAGIPSTIQQSADLIRRGGTVAMVGLSGQPAEIRPATWLLREVTLVASLGYVADEFEQTMDLMLDGRLRTEPLRSSTVPLSEIDAAFARLHESGDEIKILVDPRG